LASPLDFGAGESFLLVRPYVTGASVDARTPRQVPLEQALAIASACSRHSSRLHEAGLLCRNVKAVELILPENRDADPAIVLTDFGLGFHLNLDAESRHASAQTRCICLPNKPGHLACDVGCPSDLYAAGVLLFELLTGAPSLPARMREPCCCST